MGDKIDPRTKYGYVDSGLGEALYGKRKEPPERDPHLSNVAHGFVLEWEEAAARNRKRKLQRTSKPQPTRVPEGMSSARPIEIDDDKQLLAYGPPRPEQIPPPISPPRDTPPSPLSLTVCTCSDERNGAAGHVSCINERCKIGIYHASCVGLAHRPANATWRCRDCRPKPPPTNLQRLSSSQGSKLEPVPEPPVAEPAPLISAGPAEPPLHPEQERVVRAIEAGNNVFYTGSAGTGKSTVLKAFVQSLKSQGKQLDIVAPSGIAALNVSGTTIFSYAGWHPDSFKEGIDGFLKKAYGKNVRKRLCKTDILVIDEISMVERDALVRLDMMMREVRHGWRPDPGERPRGKMHSSRDRKLPFGGAQLVITGDFCQLPPVKPFKHCIQCGGDELPGWNKQDGKDLKCKSCPKTYSDADKWAFRSQNWENCGFQYFELKHIHRQNDQQFISILQKCRLGQTLTTQEELVLTKPKEDPVGAVKLLPKRVEVETENHRNFARLSGDTRGYECLDYFDWRSKNEPDLQKKGKRKHEDKPNGPLLALNDHRFEERVQLKVGMLVILLVNPDFSAGLVNGSQGKIVRFQKYDPSQPLIDKSRFSEKSELNELEMLKEAQMRTFIERANIKEWPVVEFHNMVTRPIIAQCQLSELGSEKPYSLLGRTQIPLIAAWAITIHKSQGMTLDRVILDLHSSFEREMVYVALSRARNLAGLKVLRLAKDKTRGVNREVADFLRQHFGPPAQTGLPSAASSTRPPQPPSKSPLFKRWRREVMEAIKDYPAMKYFPEPPAFPCGKVECQTEPRLLKACPCNVREAFEWMSVGYRLELAKWRPEKFAVCPEKDRKRFMGMAKEVLRVVEGLVREGK